MSTIFIYLSIFVHLLSCHQMELDRIESILGDQDRFVKFHDYRIKKFNRTTAVMTGTFELLMALNDDNKYGIISFESWSGGQYKQIWQKTIDPLCSGFKDTPYSEPLIGVFALAQHDGVIPDECPYEVGNYTSNNLPGDASFLPEHIPGGGEKWRIEKSVYAKDTDELLGGLRLYCNIRSGDSNYMYG